MTKMKKLSAFTAAVLAFTMVGSIGAFADTTIEASDGSASVELRGNVTYTTDITNNTIEDVWEVTVNTSALVWDVTITDAGTRTITWDPQTQTYGVTTNIGKNAVINNGATKTIAVTNKSNFDISSITTLSGDSVFQDVTDGNRTYMTSQVFSVAEISELSGVSGATNTANIAITLEKPGALFDNDPNDNDYSTINATASISFTKAGATYAYNS